jgi:hypothetical protein
MACYCQISAALVNKTLKRTISSSYFTGIRGTEVEISKANDLY